MVSSEYIQRIEDGEVFPPEGDRLKGIDVEGQGMTGAED